jgi:hypothetical protein
MAAISSKTAPAAEPVQVLLAPAGRILQELGRLDDRELLASWARCRAPASGAQQHAICWSCRSLSFRSWSAAKKSPHKMPYARDK